MQETGISHRTFFRRKRLDPLVQAGLIRATQPDEPRHPDQVPERLAVRCRPHGRCMSSGPTRLVTHLRRLVTPGSRLGHTRGRLGVRTADPSQAGAVGIDSSAVTAAR